MKTLERILAGNSINKTRLHDQKGNLIDAGGLLYLPHSLATTTMRLTVDKRPKLPWLGYRAIHYLDTLIEPDWKVLEFGSGLSTLWFAERCEAVVSVEDNREWYSEVKQMLQSRSVTNVEYQFKGESEYYRLDEHLEGYFDLILIDGSERSKCAAAALFKVKDGGYIYLDNSDKHFSPGEGDALSAEEILLGAAREKGGQVEYFVDFVPTYVAVTQGMLVRL